MKSNQVIIIDYDIGNVLSVKRAVELLGYEAVITRDHEVIKHAEKIILPGVGAFEKAMQKLNEYDLVGLLNDHVNKHKLLIGICLGMQILFDKSYEFGIHQGLGFIPGDVSRLTEVGTDFKEKFKVPHIGWCKLEWKIDALDDDESWYYFVHSYAASGQAPYVLASTNYGGNSIASMVQKENTIGFQFHPEKSGEAGLSLLKKALSQVTL